MLRDMSARGNVSARLTIRSPDRRYECAREGCMVSRQSFFGPSCPPRVPFLRQIGFSVDSAGRGPKARLESRKHIGPTRIGLISAVELLAGHRHAPFACIPEMNAMRILVCPNGTYGARRRAIRKCTDNPARSHPIFAADRHQPGTRGILRNLCRPRWRRRILAQSVNNVRRSHALTWQRRNVGHDCNLRVRRSADVPYVASGPPG
jgi:hypothetical protein